MFRAYFNLAVMLAQVALLVLAGKALARAGPVAALAFLALAAMFNAIKYRPDG